MRYHPDSRPSLEFACVVFIGEETPVTSLTSLHVSPRRWPLASGTLVRSRRRKRIKDSPTRRCTWKWSTRVLQLCRRAASFIMNSKVVAAQFVSLMITVGSSAYATGAVNMTLIRTQRS